MTLMGFTYFRKFCAYLFSLFGLEKGSSAMKVKFTPLDEIEQWLSTGSANAVIKEFETLYKRLDTAFHFLFIFPVKLTDNAMKQFLKLDGLDSELREFFMTSGILPAYDWENWTEGVELVNSESAFSKVNPVKALKLLYLIIKMDEMEAGKFEKCLKNGKILFLMERALMFKARI